MRASGGQRLPWHDIPADVRASIERGVGAAVVRADNQAGGFSPGLAARCALEDGRSVFIKAVSPEQNPQACRIHRREAEVTSKLPTTMPAPTLLHVYDDGHWVALAFEDIDGRQPTEPWTFADLDRVIPELERHGRDATPSPVHGIQDVVARHRSVFDGWRRMVGGDGDPTVFGHWCADNIEEIAATEATWEAAAGGETLLHADLRADNMLIDDRDRLWLVDWPWACVGAGFVDLVFMLPSIGLGGGPHPVDVVERYRLFDDVDPDALAAVVAALAGFFARGSLDPDPPGLPTVRAFQRAQALVAVEWLEALMGKTAT